VENDRKFLISEGDEEADVSSDQDEVFSGPASRKVFEEAKAL